jgi:hypothetical protein
MNLIAVIFFAFAYQPPEIEWSINLEEYNVSNWGGLIKDINGYLFLGFEFLDGPYDSITTGTKLLHINRAGQVEQVTYYP